MGFKYAHALPATTLTEESDNMRYWRSYSTPPTARSSLAPADQPTSGACISFFSYFSTITCPYIHGCGVQM
jgi:hypothetical protein